MRSARAAAANRHSRSLIRSAWLRDGLCAALLIGLTIVMLHPALRGDWPVGHDHPVHVVRIAELKQTLLAHGSPWTWSHGWFAGFPQNLVYPIGADLFVLAVGMLSFGTLGITQAYGIAFWLFYTLYGYATFYLVRHLFGSRPVALVAAVFLLTDGGNSDVGGWFWIVEAGVWTAALGLVPALIATVHVDRLLEEPRGRTAALVALCTGAALLCHPIHLIYFGLAVPLLCVCRYVCRNATQWRRALLLLAVGGACGLLIASFWLVPYFSAREYILEVGTPGPSLADIGNGIAAGDLFSRMFPLAFGFGVVGLLLLLKSRRPVVLFSAVFVFVCLLLSSSSLLQLFGNEIAERANKRMVFPRFFMLAKPFWYAAAAWLLVRCLGTVRDAFANAAPEAAGTGARRRLFRRAAIGAFLALVIAPIMYHAGRAFVRNEVLRPVEWNSQREDRAARIAFAEWAQGEFARTPGFFRIAHGFGDDGHRLSDLALYLPHPFYKASFTPTGHFKHNIDASSHEALRAANVRYVVSGFPLERDDMRLVTLFPPKLKVWEFTGWNPKPFVISEGEGDVEVIEFTDARITLRAGPGSEGTLRLNVSYFPKWHATRDGAPVPITPAVDPEIERSGFMQVPLLPGTYRFEYRHDISDWAGTLLCVVGLTGCGFLAFGDRLPQNRVFAALRRRFAFVNRDRVGY